MEVIAKIESLDVLCLEEHWCKEEELTAVNLRGYKLISYYSRGTYHGVVLQSI